MDKWIKECALKVFSNTDLNKLYLVIAVTLLTLWLFIDELTPFLIGVVAAYLLEAPTKLLEKYGIRRSYAALLMAILLVLFIVAFAYGLPQLFSQLRGLVGETPRAFGSLAALTDSINDVLPKYFNIDSEYMAQKLRDLGTDTGNYLIKNTLPLALDVFSLFVFIVILPLLIFFLLKDKVQLLNAFKKHLPQSPIFSELWVDMDEQFGSYVRGKAIEAALLCGVSWIAFTFFGLNYAFALALMIGLSVFVPFVGAVAVTIPVLAVAYIQFGWGADFAWIVAIYALIQTLDGQVLVPLLFSEVMKLHPVVIFLTIIFFGNLWGFWGVFFAIPLASFIKVLLVVIGSRRV